MNSLERIQQCFTDNKAYVAYITAGDGGFERSLNAALALIEGGVNLLEIGVPFSDPIADGPVIQQAASRALLEGTSLSKVLTLVKAIRLQTEIPLILFSYYNPILSALSSSFLQSAKEAGIDGLLVVDCPIEESHDLHQHCMAHGIAPIYVIAPSTSNERLALICAKAQGFLYYACRKGTTGMRSHLADDFSTRMRLIKSMSTLPVIAGFGIADRSVAEKVLEEADGVVVGSLFVKALAEGIGLNELTQLAQETYPKVKK